MGMVMEKRFCGILIVNVFVSRRLQEEYHAEGKSYIGILLDLEKDFDGVPRKVME